MYCSDCGTKLESELNYCNRCGNRVPKGEAMSVAENLFLPFESTGMTGLINQRRLESAARAWALLQGRGYVVPADVELLFAPVVMHRIVFRPSFLAEVRRTGWTAAAVQLQAECIASAPPPGH